MVKPSEFNFGVLMLPMSKSVYAMWIALKSVVAIMLKHLADWSIKTSISQKSRLTSDRTRWRDGQPQLQRFAWPARYGTTPAEREYEGWNLIQASVIGTRGGIARCAGAFPPPCFAHLVEGGSIFRSRNKDPARAAFGHLPHPAQFSGGLPPVARRAAGGGLSKRCGVVAPTPTAGLSRLPRRRQPMVRANG